ncbi:hypothetical protein A8C32_02740 [Flavivirga aquatica]|uniref:STAS/SEC14 domain-containing protein n=1 Tax=Flavivirga aquatica TaxID=1849968 RepID=A0A1E5TAM6_9FLAO|nr:hypothetical protein [Flavivirga aquatica]OEK08386.1 hypothetical protein A8C32_02740 [Flavivirga aquatica]
MKFENSDYSKSLDYFKLNLHFGNFYLCEFFFIAELNEGVHFGREQVEELIKQIIFFYGESPKLGCISNRVNSYSSDPHSWSKVENKYDIVIASAIVSYTPITSMNAKIEQQFFKKRIKNCTSLKEAIKWIENPK